MESPQEQNAFAMRAMAAGDFATARELLRVAVRQAPRATALWLNLAGACRAMGDAAAALGAVEEALRTHPRSFQALLMKASLLEAGGRVRQAAKLYEAAIGLAPEGMEMDAATTRALQHGRTLQQRHREQMQTAVEAAVGGHYETGSSERAQRMRLFTELAVGRRRNYRQEPTEFFYPGLPAIEFHDRSDFPWLADFESATDTIRDELRAVLADGSGEFTPYVAYPDSVPLDQWAGLNRSMRWSALHLYHYGNLVQANARRCPSTLQAVDALPQPQISGRSPAAMFSALQPATKIPPHSGVANTRLVVHLPLIVPAGCGFRVGNRTRQWREGEAWVFDDTIEHEAWNDSLQPRLILICDIWNPCLNNEEKQLIAAVMQAVDQFNDEPGSGSIQGRRRRG